MAAISKTLLASLLMFFLVLQFVHSVDIVVKSNGSEQSLSKEINCGALCSRRCKLSGRPNLCRRACGTCCSRCKCVPPGTYGNYHVCPCYAKLTTRGGKRKCP